MTLPSLDTNDSSGFLRPIVAQVMQIEDVTYGRNEKYVVRFRGTLTMDSMEAYDRVAAAFRERNFTPLFRIEDNRHAILAMPGVIDAGTSNPRLNLVLFALTVFSAFYTGAFYELSRCDVDVTQLLLDSLFKIYLGWPFAVGLLSILLAHEFGHYFAARQHGAPASLPYFIPLPAPISAFGTLGAVILMKAPIRNRRILHDIGIAGPLAGFIVAIPVLLIGLLRSHVETIAIPPGCGISLEGQSVVYLFLKYLVYGQLLPTPAEYGWGGPLLHWLQYYFTSRPLPLGGKDVILDQVAWAGWAGLLVTGLNLIPAGQLDGGHTLYVLLGKRLKWLVPAILVVLVLLGFFWQGWWLWAGLIYMLNRRPAELLDEITPLDNRRRILAVLTMAIFLLVFTPVPIVVVGG
jgi:Zn-dependent protease